MKLKDLLQGTSVTAVYADPDLEISGISYDSNTTKAGDVFVIPPMTIHAYYDTADLDVYHILLHKRFVADNESEAVHVKGYLQLMEIEPFLRRHFSEAMFLHLTQNQLLQLKV